MAVIALNPYCTLQKSLQFAEKVSCSAQSQQRLRFANHKMLPNHTVDSLWLLAGATQPGWPSDRGRQ